MKWHSGKRCAACCVLRISEAWLEPALLSMLAQFPFRMFRIRGFHSGNGSEFINHNVEKMLGKLLVEQTKRRPRRSNDNGLVEAKNGVVRSPARFPFRLIVR
ncbi:MAG: hypothetical protein SGI92_11710 [Bryobacteraceae bacterium]|nr:hypothetical protein [Bryobacteraceae bacterium]